MARSIADSISAGLAALARMQAADGSFPLSVAIQADRWLPYSPLFSTAYVMLGAGGLLPRDKIALAMRFIASQRRTDGLWAFHTAERAPADADCNACALAALAMHGEASQLAGGSELLRSFWREDQGPFRTWNAAGAWREAERDDPVVNCNVLFALRRLGSPATPVEEEAVRQLLRRSEKGSRYYCAPATIAHAARRAGLNFDTLPPVAAARPPASDLMASVQFLCGMPGRDSELVAAVLAAQRADGSWPLLPWIVAEANPKPFWGSAAVTAALALEALGRA
jgi:hypothetical protein